MNPIHKTIPTSYRHEAKLRCFRNLQSFHRAERRREGWFALLTLNPFHFLRVLREQRALENSARAEIEKLAKEAISEIDLLTPSPSTQKLTEAV